MSLETETLDGMPILRESPGELGLLLWQTVRSVELWASLPEDARAEAFTAEAYGARVRSIRTWEIPDEVVEPVAAAASVLRGGEVGKVVAAMRELAGWAEGEERLGTALASMRAAAKCAPEDADLAFETGRLAWASGDRAVAEMWFRQALTLARRSADRTVFGKSLQALTIVLLDRGNLPGARKLAIRAQRVADRYSLQPLRGSAHHTLASLAVLEGDQRTAVQHARLALRHYEPEHPRVPMLVGDLAYGWMLRGYFAPAQHLFQLLVARIDRPRERLFMYANLARAAGGAGDAAAFDAAFAEAAALAAAPGNQRWAAEALLEVAHGALTLGRRQEAEPLLARILDESEAGAKHQVRHQAETLLEAVRGEKAADEFRRRHRPRNPPRQIAAFADVLAEALPAAAPR